MTTTLNAIENIPKAKYLAKKSQKYISNTWKRADKWLEDKAENITEQLEITCAAGEFGASIVIDEASENDIFHEFVCKRAKSIYEEKGYKVIWDKTTRRPIVFILDWLPEHSPIN